MFDRRFLFRILSMGHSQFAELIGARGPNTQINSACASTTQAIALAEDWIRAGRCRRVVIVAADDATSDTMMGWIGAGFLASGAAATDEVVEEAALPFDERRHGMLIGMGAAGLVVESAAAARERGAHPDLRGARLGDRELRVPRHPARRRAHLRRDGAAGPPGRAPRRSTRGDRARDGVRLPRDLHAGPRRQRRGRDPRAAPGLRRGRRSDRDRQHEGLHRSSDGRRPRGRHGGQGARDGRRPAGAELPRSRPRARRCSISRGRLVPGALRTATRGGLRIADLDVAAALDASRRRSPAQPVDELGYDYRIADRAVWNAWLQRVSGDEDPKLEVVQHRLRVVDQGAPAAAVPVAAYARARSPAGAGAAPGGADACRGSRRAAAPAPVAAPVAPPVPRRLWRLAVAAPAAPACRSRRAGDGVEARVLAVVAEQTGYPTDLLDMDLDLEADLGIDTVKQAEVFASIREAYGIERDDSMKLRDYPTLNHVVGFVRDARWALAAAPPPRLRPVAAPAPWRRLRLSRLPLAEPRLRRRRVAARRRWVEARVLAVVAEQTGYPTDLLDMDLDLEADLGIDTVKQAEVFASIREPYGIERDDSMKLRDYPTLNHVVGFVRDRAGAGRRLRPPPAPVAAARAAPAPVRGSAPARRLRLSRLAVPGPRCRYGCGAGDGSRRGCWRLWLSRRVIRRICWIWIWISRLIWGSIRSSRLRCSRRSVSRMGLSVMIR